jgi:Flp pilus assembly protein TadG
MTVSRHIQKLRARLPWSKHRRAQAIVEFALITPVMVLLIMAALQVGLICMVWINLQGIAQDSARYMAVSSTAAPTYPRPRWADGDDGVTYRNSNLPTGMTAARFSSWQWNPACGSGVDCVAAGVRHADQMLVLTATYDWSNLMIMPVGIGTKYGWSFPTTITVTAAEVMQY